MKKNVYMTILTIVTILCIVTGCLLHLHIFDWNLPVFHISDGNVVFDSGEDSDAGPMTENVQSLDAFTEIEIDTNVLSATINVGDSYGVALNCNEKLIPTVSVENGKLLVKQRTKNKWFHGSTSADMLITVPAGTDLKTLTATHNVGDLKVEGVNIDVVDLKVNVGDIDLDNIAGSTLTVDSDTGDVEAEACSFKTVTIKSDVGDAEYESATNISDYKMDLETDVGDINLCNQDQDSDHYGVKHSYKQDGAAGELNIKVDVGSITVR